jgi:hypothetical protein
MASKWTSFILAIAVGAAPGASRAADPVAPAPATTLPGQDLDHPPIGAPQDLALWRSGFEITNTLQIERARATRLQAVLLSLRYTDRLQSLTARGGEPGERGAALARRLADAHAAQFAVLTGRSPIDPWRVCSFPAMEFGSMLSYDKADPGELARHRAMLLGCVEQAQEYASAMKQGNDGLEAAMAAADAALLPAGLGPTTTTPATTPAKSPAEHDETREPHDHGEKHGGGHREGR